MSLPITVPIDPGSGTVKSGSVRLFLVSPGSGDGATPLTPPGVMTPDAVNGDNYRFELDCVRTGDLYVRYTLEEGGTEQTFTVPIGGLTLIDPQGVVYDQTVFNQRKDAGDTDEQARAAAAITGATVTLQRKVGDEFQTVLSGDPGISPHVNPQTTGADGKFQWDVSAGIYRVVVQKDGFQTVTSPSYDIPPPKLDAHIAMTRVVADGDGDGVADGSDNCPGVANPGQLNTDGAGDGGDACDADDDNDTVADGADNCAVVANPNQQNTDGAGDGGDACDADDDNDTVADGSDNCAVVANPGQTNTDGAGDGGDACDADDDNDTVVDGSDNCSLVANPGQTNTDGAGDGGDACDADDDNDTVADGADGCPTTPAATPDGCPASGGDGDGDGIADAGDNCPGVANPGQQNTDGAGDGGDACDADDDNDTVVDGSDNCAVVANTNQLNTDGANDGGNACDADDDNDTVNDGGDNCPVAANAGSAEQRQHSRRRRRL